MTLETISQKQPKVFATPFADSGDKNTIPDTGVDAVNIQQGFPEIFSTPRANSGKSVARKDMNGILNSLSSLNYYFQYMGRNPWVAGTSYPKGAKVWYNNAEWISPYDNNTATPGSQAEDGSDAWIAINDLGGTVGAMTDTSATDELKSLMTQLLAKVETMETNAARYGMGTIDLSHALIDKTGVMADSFTNGETATVNTYNTKYPAIVSALASTTFRTQVSYTAKVTRENGSTDILTKYSLWWSPSSSEYSGCGYSPLLPAHVEVSTENSYIGVGFYMIYPVDILVANVDKLGATIVSADLSDPTEVILPSDCSKDTIVRLDIPVGSTVSVRMKSLDTTSAVWTGHVAMRRDMPYFYLPKNNQFYLYCSDDGVSTIDYVIYSIREF